MADITTDLLGVRWLNTPSSHLIGVVAIKTRLGFKAYLGVAGGGDEKADLAAIYRHGAKLTEGEARAFFPWVTYPYES